MMTTILQSYRVKPANPVNEIKRTKLEGMDKNNYSSITIFFGYSNPTLGYENIIEKIKHDLSILQDNFPMISGKIEYDYEANDAQLIYDGGGVVVVEAENNTTSMSDLSIQHDNSDMAAAQVVSELFTPDIKSLKQKFNVQHFPFIVQITKLKCDSVVLTTINSHMLMDGTTYVMLQEAWKTISKGQPNTIIPDNKKIEYGQIELEGELPKGWMEIPKHILFQEPSTHSTPSCRFHFSKEKIASFKENLSKLIKEQDEAKYVTTDEIISSILWKSVVKHRKTGANQLTTFVRPTNIRGLLKPMLSENSVGNLAVMNSITLSSEQVLSLNILDIIQKIQLQKQLFTKDKVLQTYKCFTELSSDKCLVLDSVGMGIDDIFINSWTKFTSLSSFDIGFGNNTFVCVPPKFSGAILVFPTCSHQLEGFLAHAYLPENVLQDMQNDPELLRYLC